MFGLALRRAGFDCIGISEIDEHARAVTRYHYPNTPQFGDVAHVRPTQPFDLLVGGFPCQDLSMAGNRRGLAGERSGLFWEIIRIARESSGRWENSGMGGPTACLTLNTSEFHSDAVASSLSDVLETSGVPAKYSLSPKACAGILRRAEKRGRVLPVALSRALALGARSRTL
jgi:hypothetical protein